jgi:hypothetical protein
MIYIGIGLFEISDNGQRADINIGPITDSSCKKYN